MANILTSNIVPNPFATMITSRLKRLLVLSVTLLAALSAAQTPEGFAPEVSRKLSVTYGNTSVQPGITLQKARTSRLDFQPVSASLTVTTDSFGSGAKRAQFGSWEWISSRDFPLHYAWYGDRISPHEIQTDGNRPRRPT